MATITGKQVRYGMTALSNALITSAELNYTDEAKEYADHDGSTVSIVTDVNPRCEATITVTMLEDTELSSLKETVAAWLAEEAVNELGMASGGTAVVTDAKQSESNTDAATATVTAIYFPNVTAS